jgi:hypothetical protein
MDKVTGNDWRSISKNVWMLSDLKDDGTVVFHFGKPEDDLVMVLYFNDITAVGRMHAYLGTTLEEHARQQEAKRFAAAPVEVIRD